MMLRYAIFGFNTFTKSTGMFRYFYIKYRCKSIQKYRDRKTIIRPSILHLIVPWNMPTNEMYAAEPEKYHQQLHPHTSLHHTNKNIFAHTLVIDGRILTYKVKVLLHTPYTHVVFDYYYFINRLDFFLFTPLLKYPLMFYWLWNINWHNYQWMHLTLMDTSF